MFLNDHSLIHDEITPSVLIFKDQKHDNPFHLDGFDSSFLGNLLTNLVKSIKEPLAD